MAYTVSHQGEGFTSFFSFIPEMAIGLNNYLYTFKDGQIYKHGFGNTFYGSGTSPRVITYFNDSPTTVKLFKTVSIDGTYDTNAVTGYLYSEMSNKRYAGKVISFDRMEGIDYSNIISINWSNPIDYSLNGIGQLLSSSGDKYTIISDDRAYVPSIGVDFLCYIDGADIVDVGEISAYKDNGSQHEYYVSGTLMAPLPGANMLIKRNLSAESYGLRGTSLMVDIKLNTLDEFEIFSVSTNVFKSFP